MATGVSHAILNQDDPETVRVGAPAYLLLLDGLIADRPQDPATLLWGARLYGAYAAVFVDDADRSARLSGKARDYARRALCVRQPTVCAREKAPYPDYVSALAQVPASDVAALYSYGAAWAQVLRACHRRWEAAADLPRVEAIMVRVVQLDEAIDHGRAHLYLGVMRTQLPPALGGRPEEGRAHFERAIALSGGRDLMAKVEYARWYARLVFDRDLHDRLLQEVLAADPVEPDLTLSNVLAQREARSLLATSQEYFGE